ncbi:hypothetical protein SMJ63A_70123 [Stenotrophomonas geniculata]
MPCGRSGLGCRHAVADGCDHCVDGAPGRNPMPAGMFSTSGRNCLLAVVLSLAALPAAAQSPTPSLFCGFWTEEADGTWSVPREVDAATGATASRDTYEWTSNSTPFGTGMASSWTLNYY